MRRAMTITLVALLAVVLPDVVLGSISVAYPDSAHYRHQSFCPVGDGESHLAPDPVQNPGEFFMLDGVSCDAANELLSGDTDFSGWTFNYDTWGTANGTFYIDEYRSRFYGNHFSGAHIQGRYNRAPGDPVDLQWIQYVSPERPFDPDVVFDPSTALPVSNGPIPPANGGFIDPYPNDGTDGGPFYWNSDEIGLYTHGSDEFGTYDLKFEDSPRGPHPPVSSNGMQFELYLVDQHTNGQIDFLGGIQWGWHGSCAPEPTSLLLLAVASLLARRRLRAL